MTMRTQCDNVKEVARSDEPKENYHLNLKRRSALWSFKVSVSSLFSCLATTLLFLFTLTAFSDTAGNCFQRKISTKPTVHYLPIIQQQTDKVSN